MGKRPGTFSLFGVLLLSLAVVTSGCMGPAAPAPDPVDTTKPILPPDPPQSATDTNATVLAAILNRTSGGIAAFESGVSGIILFTDGTVVALEGLPWGARDRFGSCPAAVQGVLAKAAVWLKANGTIECGRDMVAASRLAKMDAASATHIATYLGRHMHLVVPAERQQAECCDRVFTGHIVWANGQETFYLDEGPTGPALPPSTTSSSATSHAGTSTPTASGSADVDAVVAQLNLLANWMQDG